MKNANTTETKVLIKIIIVESDVEKQFFFKKCVMKQLSTKKKLIRSHSSRVHRHFFSVAVLNIIHHLILLVSPSIISSSSFMQNVGTENPPYPETYTLLLEKHNQYSSRKINFDQFLVKVVILRLLQFSQSFMCKLSVDFCH
jgi:hypothetical protein